LKTGLIIGFILTGLLVIAWPMGVFASIFLFDAPIHSDQDEAVRYGAAGSILFYPVIWGVALAAAIKTLKKQKIEAVCGVDRRPYPLVVCSHFTSGSLVQPIPNRPAG
jgi:hypothetical protein